MICRHCGTPLTVPVLDLGRAPPSNAYRDAADLARPEPHLPLRLLACDACWLVQIADDLPSDALFAPDYAYFSSFSASWLAHAERYVAEMTTRFDLGPSSSVCEIASNDGYLLQYVARAGIPCWGVEPTASTAAAARARGIETVEAFFGRDLARRLAAEGRTADLMVANNVLAHVPDIDDFVAGFPLVLKPTGVATFEFPSVVDMVEQGQFDIAYHEHYSYPSLTTVVRVFAAAGLHVFDVEEFPTQGGSLRIYATRADGPARPATPAVAALLADEAARGVASPAFYGRLQARAEAIRDGLRAFLEAAKARGETVAAYGAAAKGNTLLNFAGIGPDLLPFVVDRNPAKQGRFLPGSHIPVRDEAALWAARPDHVLILPWNLRDEIAGQLAGIAAWGGRFVVAVPELRGFAPPGGA